MSSHKPKLPFITKTSGETVPFSPEQLHTSLRRAGAAEAVADHILEQVLQQIYEGMSTRKIYQLAFKILRKKSKPIAARYRLKSAIMELGPSGFPFEKFIGEVLRYQGFNVEVGVVVSGRCVNHEVDIIAGRGDDIYLVECKYHN